MSEQLGFDLFETHDAAEQDEHARSDAVEQDERARSDATEQPDRDTSGAAKQPEGEASAPTEPLVLSELRAVTKEHPFRRKLLIGSTRGEGREILRSLTRSGTPWIGWEATTIGPLAAEIAAPWVAREGLRVIDDFDFTRLVDVAIDRVLVDRRVEGFSDLAESLGFRQSIRNAVSTLRLAGKTSGEVAKAPFRDHAKRRVLVDILKAYEASLAREGAVDPADILSRALGRLDHEERWSDALLLVLPGQNVRGLAGRLLSALVDRHGARCLAADPVMGLSVPSGILWPTGSPVSRGSFLHMPEAAPEHGITLEVFSASTVNEEVREVLRRVLEGGFAWDEVEIITPDPQTYGSALHQLCERLDIPVTFGVGLPIERTRPGRVVTEFFRWLDAGFSADVIRGLLEAGDLRPPPPLEEVTPMELVRRFRELRVGWGRARYLRRIDGWLKALETAEPGRRESQKDMERRTTRVRRELNALRAILAPTLEAIPGGVPDPASGPDTSPVTPAALAAGLDSFLDRVELRDAPDETALARIRQVLERVRATLTRPCEFRAAAAIVRAALEIRVPSPREDGRAPWGTRHGHLHLTDLIHGGRTGRRATFIVGMDAGRFPGAGRQDPLLLDRERMALGGDALPTSAERVSEATFGFARLLARLRSTVFVSYATWEPAEARDLSPAADVVAAFRLSSGDPRALFEDLRRAVGEGAGIVPQTSHLDAQDVWMSALFRDGRPLDGREVLDAAFSGQARGSLAVGAHQRDEPSSWVGQLAARPALDPRKDPNRLVSASALEALGSCPRRYFFRDVLRLRPPVDPHYDPDVWLTPLDRGALLHRVYERALHVGREQGFVPDSAAFAEEALRVLRREAARARDIHPTPSRDVQVRELQALEDDVQSFVSMVRTYGANWRSLERKFGFDDEPPVEIRLYGGSLRVRGAIDRVDETDDGLLVLDYKTGSAYSADGDTGTFNGGRRLQNVIYTMVARELEGLPVVRMEYHYATRKARNAVLGFTPEQLRNGPFLMDRMLDGVAEGSFPATDDPDDCRWCDFKAVCRVRENGGNLDSPHAAWTKRALSSEDDVPAWLRALRDVRQEEGPGIAVPLETLRQST